MNLPSATDLKALAVWNRGPAVSIYMPLHRSGPDNKQDAIQLKNSLRDAQRQLEALGMRRSEAEDMLAPAWKLQQDSQFWIHHSANGLALFVGPGLFRYHRVPHNVEKLLVVADSFHIKPLLPLLLHDGRFYLLALSESSLRLYYGTKTGISPVALPERMPKSINDLLAGRQAKPVPQHHTVADGGSSGPSVRITHEEGQVTDAERKSLEDYFRQVASALGDMMKDQRVPLVLAAADSYHPTFRRIYGSSNLLEKGVVGNPDAMSGKELHKRAWPLVEAWFGQESKRAAERYGAALGAGQTSQSLVDIVPAAHRARVDTIFAAIGVHIWGTYDPVTGQLAIHNEHQPGDVDLSDLSVEQTLLNGGQIHVTVPERVPGNAREVPVAAIFRW